MAYLGEAGIKLSGDVKHNLAAVVNPTVTDDATADYAVGSRWVNLSTDEEWVCTDPTGGAAVWEHTTTATENNQNASQVPFTPVGDIASTNVQAALGELDTEKEPAFAKNTGFNKNFGTGAGTVAEGNHLHEAQYVNTSGDTMTGNLILNADPTVALGAVTKQYADGLGHFTLFPTPLLVATVATKNVWITHSDASLAAAGAKYALIKFYLEDFILLTASSCAVWGFLRKTGSGAAKSFTTMVLTSRDTDDFSGGNGAYTQCAGIGVVELDSNQDFDFMVDTTTTGLNNLQIDIMGYWS